MRVSLTAKAEDSKSRRKAMIDSYDPLSSVIELGILGVLSG